MFKNVIDKSVIENSWYCELLTEIYIDTEGIYE